MAYDDDATGEILQILFQDLEGLYVQVIGGPSAQYRDTVCVAVLH